MQYTRENRVLCFVHNAKTAGTSILSTAFRDRPDKTFWYAHPGEKDWSECSPEYLSQFDFVGGHLPRAEFDQKITRPKLFMTIVREPVSRAFSLFSYMTSESHHLRSELADKGMLWALENHTIFQEQVFNQQCWMIGGDQSFEAALDAIAANDWILACHEQADRAWLRACLAMGWPASELRRENISQPGYQDRLFDPRIVDILESNNSEDRRLIDFVKKVSEIGA